MKTFQLKKITVSEIAVAGFLLVLIILSNQDFFRINMGVMKTGVSYAFYITSAIILGFFLGLAVSVTGDTLALAIQGKMGQWHYAYFVIPIFITIITNLFKLLFKVKNHRVVLAFNTLFFAAMAATIAGILFLKRDFSNRSLNLADETAQIAIWIVFSFMVIGTLGISILYWKKQMHNLKNYMIINIIVSAIIITMVWFYGPVAWILWTGATDWSGYSAYQIPRILKTPFTWPAYVLIVSAIFKVYTKISVFSAPKW